jgi:hypothetical protein
MMKEEIQAASSEELERLLEIAVQTRGGVARGQERMIRDELYFRKTGQKRPKKQSPMR